MRNIFFILSMISITSSLSCASQSNTSDLFETADLEQQSEILRTISFGYMDVKRDYHQSIFKDPDYQKIMFTIGSAESLHHAVQSARDDYKLDRYYSPEYAYHIAVRLVYDGLSPFIERLYEKHFNSDTHFLMANLYESRGQYSNAWLVCNHALFLTKKEKQEAMLPPELLKGHFRPEVLKKYDNFYADFLGY